VEGEITGRDCLANLHDNWHFSSGVISLVRQLKCDLKNPSIAYGRRHPDPWNGDDTFNPYKLERWLLVQGKQLCTFRLSG
jgi:hypothetical protein